DVANDESNDVIDESDDGSDGWRNWIKKNSFQNILAILLNHSRKILNKRILIKTFAFYLNNSKWWIFPAIVLFLSYCYTCQFSLSNHQCAFWIIKTTDLDSQYRNYIVINDDDDHHQNQYEVGFEYSDSLVRAVIEEQVKNICAAEVEKRIKPPPSQQAKHEITTYRRYVVDDVIANLIRNEIHKSVEEKLYDYSQDKLNRADYALSSGGAKIISMLTSPTYETWPTKWFQQIIASVTGHGITRGKPPITAIQPEMHVGQCWPFAGEKGQLAVLLSRKIISSSFNVDATLSTSTKNGIDSKNKNSIIKPTNLFSPPPSKLLLTKKCAKRTFDDDETCNKGTCSCSEEKEIGKDNADKSYNNNDDDIIANNSCSNYSYSSTEDGCDDDDNFVDEDGYIEDVEDDDEEEDDDDEEDDDEEDDEEDENDDDEEDEDEYDTFIDQSRRIDSTDSEEEEILPIITKRENAKHTN
ncbi:13695_t:CDS:2, partial [Entrophospora sp. SA101]